MEEGKPWGHAPLQSLSPTAHHKGQRHGSPPTRPAWDLRVLKDSTRSSLLACPGPSICRTTTRAPVTGHGGSVWGHVPGHTSSK